MVGEQGNKEILVFKGHSAQDLDFQGIVRRSGTIQGDPGMQAIARRCMTKRISGRKALGSFEQQRIKPEIPPTLFRGRLEVSKLQIQTSLFSIRLEGLLLVGYNVADENDHLISWTGNNVADEIVLFWDPAVIVREYGAGGWSTWWWRKWYILEWQVRGEMVRGCFWCVWWW